MQKRSCKNSTHNVHLAHNCMGALRKEPYRAQNSTNVYAIYFCESFVTVT